MSQKQKIENQQSTSINEQKQKIENQQSTSINEQKQAFFSELVYFNADVTALAEKLQVTRNECLFLLIQRELALQTRELRMMHEHLDDRLAIRKKKVKPKAH